MFEQLSCRRQYHPRKQKQMYPLLLQLLNNLRRPQRLRLQVQEVKSLLQSQMNVDYRKILHPERRNRLTSPTGIH